MPLTPLLETVGKKPREANDAETVSVEATFFTSTVKVVARCMALVEVLTHTVGVQVTSAMAMAPRVVAARVTDVVVLAVAPPADGVPVIVNNTAPGTNGPVPAGI